MAQLFSAMLGGHGTVVWQVHVPPGANEITQVETSLNLMGVEEALIIADRHVPKTAHRTPRT